MLSTVSTTSSVNHNKENVAAATVVVLLLIPDDLQTYALSVTEQLQRRFAIKHVSIRSIQTPVDRLLSLLSTTTNHSTDGTEKPRPPTLLVVLGTSTATTAVMESESAVPIITLPHENNTAATALAIAKCCSLAHASIRQAVEIAVHEQRAARLIQDAQLRTSSPRYTQAIAQCYASTAAVAKDGTVDDYWTTWGVSAPVRGKVRDRFEVSSQHTCVLVTTDRQSGFDRLLAKVPYKGAVLNLTSAFWFQNTRHIISNHLMDVPHPYVSVCRQCTPFPIEFVVRAYLTGSTSTSIWTQYNSGVRHYCGHELPDGMTKNQPLPSVLLTPTTKEADHDRPLSLADIVDEHWMTQQDLDVCAKAALELFRYGQQHAAKQGLLLVDTKYEFGRDQETGDIMLIDEVHTPDSSRYWLASTYHSKVVTQGLEPDNIDKEFLRLWYKERCDPYDTSQALPEAPSSLVHELSRRYICLYEMITGQEFDWDSIQTASESLPTVLKSRLATEK